MDLVFEDPPEREYGRIASELREALQELRNHPGRFAVVFEGKSSTADSRKSSLYQSVIPSLIKDGGSYEVRVLRDPPGGDTKKVYVRYFPTSDNGDAG